MKISYFRTAYVTDTTAEERDLVDRQINHWAEGDGGICVTRESIAEWLEDHQSNLDEGNEVSEAEKKLAKFLKKVEATFDGGDIGDVIFSS